MFCVYEIMRCVHKLEMKINDKNNWHYKILIKPKDQKYAKNSKKCARVGEVSSVKKGFISRYIGV